MDVPDFLRTNSWSFPLLLAYRRHHHIFTCKGATAIKVRVPLPVVRHDSERLTLHLPRHHQMLVMSDILELCRLNFQLFSFDPTVSYESTMC
jgi:hypothetical protein